jgi:hypothetical protein
LTFIVTSPGRTDFNGSTWKTQPDRTTQPVPTATIADALQYIRRNSNRGVSDSDIEPPNIEANAHENSNLPEKERYGRLTQIIEGESSVTEWAPNTSQRRSPVAE